MGGRRKPPAGTRQSPHDQGTKALLADAAIGKAGLPGVGIVVRMHQWKSEETATAWDGQGSEVLPTRAPQQDLLLALLDPSGIDNGAVLDLGIGSGLVAEVVLEALPNAQIVGIDFSDAMLNLARERLSRFGSRVVLRTHDLSDLDRID